MSDAIGELYDRLVTLEKQVREMDRRVHTAPLLAGKAKLLTIVAGEIDATKPHIQLLAETGTTDNLDTISGGQDGKFVILSTGNPAHNITVRDMAVAGGNIDLHSTNYILDNANASLFLYYVELSATWHLAGIPRLEELRNMDLEAAITDDLVHKKSDGEWGAISPGALVGGSPPAAHASTHQHLGSDQVATATPAANAIPKADASGTLNDWIATGTSAATTDDSIDDADLFGRVSGGVWVKTAWSNIKAVLLTYFSTFFAVLAGTAGGQTLKGGTASGDDLILESTNHATKGDVLIQPSGGFVAIGHSIPIVSLDVRKTGSVGINAQTADDTSGSFVENSLLTNGSDVQLYFHVFDTLVTGTRFGLTLGGWAEILAAGSGLLGLIVGTNTADPLVFGTNSVERGRILSSGEWGIGTTSPATKLDINGFMRWNGLKRVSTQFDKTNVTLATVTGLSVNVEASKSYKFIATLFIDANVTGGHKVAIAGTATATAIIYHIGSVDDATNLFVITSRQTALGGSAGQAGATTVLCTVEGTITVNAAGTLLVQFAQQAASGTSSVLVGSTFEVNEMA